MYISLANKASATLCSKAVILIIVVDVCVCVCVCVVCLVLLSEVVLSVISI